MAAEPDDLRGVERILVVTAHPDDVDFGMAGSVATWVEAGREVAYCIVTDGDAGGSDRSVPRTDMARMRRQEQSDAAAVVGVDSVTFLGYPDGRLQPTMDLRRDVSRLIRTFQPQRVVTQSPERSWLSVYADHPDHLAAGQATASAVYPDARNPFAHPELLEEGLEPHVVAQLWFASRPDANRFVDATELLDRKLEALRRHRSQVGEGEHLEDLLRGWMGRTAASAGLPEGRLAEAFFALETA